MCVQQLEIKLPIVVFKKLGKSQAAFACDLSGTIHTGITIVNVFLVLFLNVNNNNNNIKYTR